MTNMRERKPRKSRFGATRDDTGTAWDDSWDVGLNEDAMQEREKFEAIATREGWLHSDWKLMRMDGLPVRYLDANLQKRWDGWQARAALVDGPGSNTFTGHDGELYALGTSGSVETAYDKILADAQRHSLEIAPCGHTKKWEIHNLHGGVGCMICEQEARESAWQARMTRLSFEVTGNDYALEKMTPDEVTKAFQDYRERAIEDAETAWQAEREQWKAIAQRALIPLAALVVSGECTTDKSALCEEIKRSIVEAHDELLAMLASGPQPIPERKA